MTSSAASSACDTEHPPGVGSCDVHAPSASPVKITQRYKRFDECPSIETRFQDIPQAMRLATVKSDYFLNEGRRITLPLFDAAGNRTISKHEMNRVPNEARVQELMVSIRSDGNATDMTGVPIMVQAGPSRWQALTYHHRVVAMYRLIELYPDDPVVQSIVSTGLEGCMEVDGRIPQDVASWVKRFGNKFGGSNEYCLEEYFEDIARGEASWNAEVKKEKLVSTRCATNGNNNTSAWRKLFETHFFQKFKDVCGSGRELHDAVTFRSSMLKYGYWESFLEILRCESKSTDHRLSHRAFVGNAHAIMTTLDKIRGKLTDEDHKMVVLNLLRLCLPRIVDYTEQPFVLDQLSTDVIDTMLTVVKVDGAEPDKPIENVCGWAMKMCELDKVTTVVQDIFDMMESVISQINQRLRSTDTILKLKTSISLRALEFVITKQMDRKMPTQSKRKQNVIQKTPTEQKTPKKTTTTKFKHVRKMLKSELFGELKEHMRPTAAPKRNARGGRRSAGGSGAQSVEGAAGGQSPQTSASPDKVAELVKRAHAAALDDDGQHAFMVFLGGNNPTKMIKMHHTLTDLTDGMFNAEFDEEQGAEVDEILTELAELMFEKLPKQWLHFVRMALQVLDAAQSDEMARHALQQLSDLRGSTSTPSCSQDAEKDNDHGLRHHLFHMLLWSHFGCESDARSFLTLRGKYVLRILAEACSGNDRLSNEDYSLTVFHMSGVCTDSVLMDEALIMEKPLWIRWWKKFFDALDTNIAQVPSTYANENAASTAAFTVFQEWVKNKCPEETVVVKAEAEKVGDDTGVAKEPTEAAVAEEPEVQLVVSTLPEPYTASPSVTLADATSSWAIFGRGFSITPGSDEGKGMQGMPSTPLARLKLVRQFQAQLQHALWTVSFSKECGIEHVYVNPSLLAAHCSGKGDGVTTGVLATSTTTDIKLFFHGAITNVQSSQSVLVCNAFDESWYINGSFSANSSSDWLSIAWSIPAAMPEFATMEFATVWHALKVPLKFPQHIEISVAFTYLQMKSAFRDQTNVELSRPFLPCELSAIEAAPKVKPMKRISERFKDACLAKNLHHEEDGSALDTSRKRVKRDPALRRVAHLIS